MSLFRLKPMVYCLPSLWLFRGTGFGSTCSGRIRIPSGSCCPLEDMTIGRVPILCSLSSDGGPLPPFLNLSLRETPRTTVSSDFRLPLRVYDSLWETVGSGWESVFQNRRKIFQNSGHHVTSITFVVILGSG